jgi:hypothetical protein
MNNGRFVQSAIVLLFGLYGLSTIPNKDQYFPFFCLVVGWVIAFSIGIIIPSVDRLRFWWYSDWNI